MNIVVDGDGSSFKDWSLVEDDDLLSVFAENVIKELLGVDSRDLYRIYLYSLFLI